MPSAALRRVPAVALGTLPRSLPRSLAAAVTTAVLTAGCLALSASGGVIIDAAGTSAAGNSVAFRATLKFAGDELVLDLENVSPVATSDPADVLASFYFDFVRKEARPPLVLRSAVGQVYRVLEGGPDEPVIYTPPAEADGKAILEEGLGCSDLVATKPGDLTWMFRQLDPKQEPLGGFGLGTVGNAKLTSANFDTTIVGADDFAIFRTGDRGDLEPKGSLAGQFLACELVRFTFGGAWGWSEADLGPRVAFGLGENPASVLVVSVSEPVVLPAVAVAVTGVLPFIGRGRRQAARRAGAAGSVASRGGSAAVPPMVPATAGSVGLACRPISRDTNTAM